MISCLGRSVVRQFLTFLLVEISLGLMGVGVADPIDFNREIRPILSDNCFQCHGPDAAERKGDLRLDTEDGAYARTLEFLGSING